MANKFVRLEIGFYRHPKTRRLKRLIGDAAFWVPPRLWAYCVEQEKDDISDLSPLDLAEMLEYAGDATALVAALIETKFLSDDGKTVRGWAEVYGKLIQFYADRAKLGAEARWGKSKQIQDETRIDRKHGEASNKDASSILQASSDEPEMFPKTSSDTPTAEAIYEAYPLKRDRIDAIKAIKSAIKRGVPAERLLKRTQAFSAAVARWPDSKKEYLKYPATWFNKGSYDDDPSTWEKSFAPAGQQPESPKEAPRYSDADFMHLSETNPQLFASLITKWPSLLAQAKRQGIAPKQPITSNTV